MVRAVAGKRFDIRAAIPADDELGDLAMALNEMASGLQERERMSRFVSDQVLEEVMKEDGQQSGSGRRAARGRSPPHAHPPFCRVVQTKPSLALIEMPNGYFTFVSTCITRDQDSNDKLIVDAVMAVFLHHPDSEHPSSRVGIRPGPERTTRARQMPDPGCSFSGTHFMSLPSKVSLSRERLCISC